MSSTSTVAGVLVHNCYGKSRVRLSKIVRDGSVHQLKEMSIDVQLEGEFEDSYKTGDNSKIVATDSMKNSCYVLASENKFDDIESFGTILAKHFLNTYSHVASARVSITEDLWNRIAINGKEHEHSFVSAGSEKRVTHVSADRKGTLIESGLEDLVVAKTTATEFWGFIRDRYTTLPEVKDRIFATSVMVRYIFGSGKANYNSTYKSVRDTVLNVFATQHSLAVQSTLHEMAEKIIEKCEEIDEVTISMPNQHRLLINLTPFGLENRNEIFVPTDEPYGLISGTYKRKAR